MTNATINRSITVTADSGELILGHNADTPVRWRLSDGGRLRSGAIIGRSATGKTTLLSGIAASAINAGIQVWTGQAYDHYPALATGIAHRAYGVGGARDLLYDAVLLADERNTYDMRDGVDLRPWPPVLILLDDATEALADDEINGMICSIPLNEAWAGIGVITATTTIADLGRLMEQQYVLLGDPANHRWSMPTGQAASEHPFDGHLVLADDFMPLTATPFTFDRS